jgi:pimeloyl-ACP methyl ester carboxylesterase
MPRAQTNGIELEYETFGDPSNPTVLLIMGLGVQMLGWDERFCKMLADRGFHVVRFDNRDIGLSTKIEGGAAPNPLELMAGDFSSASYTLDDMADDTAGLLDALDVEAAHVVGVSMGGALAQLLALDFADRVVSLALISTSPAMRGDRPLPGSAEELGRFLASVEVDWSDPESVIRYLVEYSRVLAGGQRPFDEAAVGELARRDVDRARDFTAAQNHDALSADERSREPLSSIAAPTLVIHGSADPMFPPEHGAALAEAIPNARLLKLEGAGHGLDRADWETVAQAIIRHTDIQSTR